MSGAWIRKERPLTLREIRDFLNEFEESDGHDNPVLDDYLSVDDDKRSLIYGIHTAGLRFNNRKEYAITNIGRNTLLYDKCECCGSLRRKKYGDNDGEYLG